VTTTSYTIITEAASGGGAEMGIYLKAGRGGWEDIFAPPPLPTYPTHGCASVVVITPTTTTTTITTTAW